jgi:shikimate dehydrogenase
MKNLRKKFLRITKLSSTPHHLERIPIQRLFPDLDYSLFTSKHLAFDLIYNPEETEFLKRAKANGASTKNGYEMLVFQAEKAWRIWNKK